MERMAIVANHMEKIDDWERLLIQLYEDSAQKLSKDTTKTEDELGKPPPEADVELGTVVKAPFRLLLLFRKW